MIEKLQQVEEHFGEVESRLGDPSVVADVEKFTKLTREHAALLPIVIFMTRRNFHGNSIY